MRSRFLQVALGLLIAGLLASPDAWCCGCCSPTPGQADVAAHESGRKGCCSKSGAVPERDPADGRASCGCREIVAESTEAPRPAYAIASSASADPEAPSIAIVCPATDTTHRSAGFHRRPPESPPRLWLSPFSADSPRGPPVGLS